MDKENNAIDLFFQQMEEECLNKISDELLGTKYNITKKMGIGTISRMIIEKGLEVAYWNSSSTMKLVYKNQIHDNNTIEVLYCYNGDVEISSFPNDKRYKIKKGDISFYKMENSIEYFSFYYKEFAAISIHVDLNVVKNSINPLLRERVIGEWKKHLDNIFVNDILIIEKAPLNIKSIAEDIRELPLNTIVDYMRFKSKITEFLLLSLQHKSDRNYKISNFTKDEVNTIYKIKNLLLENSQSPPSIQEISKRFNISIYKLQRGFKEITGDTVYEYIRKARIEKAKNLLRKTDMPIIYIANEVGYENPSKFSNAFKSYTQMTPSEYRYSQLI
ncbi:AraC family transcriptional regulator [Tissierella sp. MSJ-40]|uniref:AraC family transcriptional regulator n=1 Tax=Tissierella simiarum TaxID=2841534 RepID=A0ABS6E6Q1_9FIRM|nr:AraC family transcriptional regulator [Tissierella simiarum]MBU5438587.1 AraC family transcriptional regulator [Tissierella simiarum]